ncbi:MAG: hypothetical protein II888_05120 [Clostridia bacterium]|nr:hypothetical protein [Clostridia bacterium]
MLHGGSPFVICLPLVSGIRPAAGTFRGLRCFYACADALLYHGKKPDGNEKISVFCLFCDLFSLLKNGSIFMRLKEKKREMGWMNLQGGTG